jgi:hypothetical protein
MPHAEATAARRGRLIVAGDDRSAQIFSHVGVGGMSGMCDLSMHSITARIPADGRKLKPTNPPRMPSRRTTANKNHISASFIAPPAGRIVTCLSTGRRAFERALRPRRDGTGLGVADTSANWGRILFSGGRQSRRADRHEKTVIRERRTRRQAARSGQTDRSPSRDMKHAVENFFDRIFRAY